MAGSTRVCPKCGNVERIRPEELNGEVESDKPFAVDDEGDIICTNCGVKTKHISEMDK